MIPIQGLFESHLTVSDLESSIAFYRGTLGLELAHHDADRKVAFFWVGGRGASMLGLWEASGDSPRRDPQLAFRHIAFRVELTDLLKAAERLHAACVEPLDFWGHPSGELTVLTWMPAVSIYFHDPDGNLLEFLTMLPGAPRPELGVVGWNRWKSL